MARRLTILGEVVSVAVYEAVMIPPAKDSPRVDVMVLIQTTSPETITTVLGDAVVDAEQAARAMAKAPRRLRESIRARFGNELMDLSHRRDSRIALRAVGITTSVQEMIRRTEIDFAIRTDSAAVPELAETLASTLGCSFAEGEFRNLPALVAEVLGLRISLSPWRGVGGKRVFRLHGEVVEPGFLDRPEDERLEFDRVDISAFMVDLLNIRTRYRWYAPTLADLDAENEHARAIDRAVEEP